MKAFFNKAIFAVIQSLIVCLFVFLIELSASFFIKDFLQTANTFGIIFIILSIFFFFFSKGTSPEIIQSKTKKDFPEL